MSPLNLEDMKFSARSDPSDYTSEVKQIKNKIIIGPLAQFILSTGLLNFM